MVHQQPNSSEAVPGNRCPSWATRPHPDDHSELPVIFGFRGGERGPHASRTMMLREITDILAAVPDDAPKPVYRDAIMEDNVLGKRTIVTRRESYERLGWLYALDPGVTLFRLLRFFWQRDPEGMPILALLCAAARDPLLRMTVNTVLKTPLNEPLSNEAMEEAITLGAPGSRALIVMFEEHGDRYELRLDEVSDGQRALIALYSLVRLAAGQGYTLFLDEPDNYIALAEIQPWLIDLSYACGGEVPQAVICSHHPQLIDYLGADRGLLLKRESTGVTIAKGLGELTATDGLKLSELITRGWEMRGVRNTALDFNQHQHCIRPQAAELARKASDE